MPDNSKSLPNSNLDIEIPKESVTFSHQAAALRCQALEAEVQLWKVCRA